MSYQSNAHFLAAGGGSIKPGGPLLLKYSKLSATVFLYIHLVWTCREGAQLTLLALVSNRVLNYPMGALIELESLLIVSLDEREVEGKKRKQLGAAKRSREPGTWVSATDT